MDRQGGDERVWLVLSIFAKRKYFKYSLYNAFKDTQETAPLFTIELINTTIMMGWIQTKCKCMYVIRKRISFFFFCFTFLF